MMQAQAIRSPLGAFVRSPLGVRQTRVGNEGYLYMWCYTSGGTGLYLRKHNAKDMALVWSVQPGVSSDIRFTRLLTATSGYVYLGTPTETLKYNTSGSLIWARNHGAAVNAISVDVDGNVHTSGDRIGGITTRKYDKDGNLLWIADHGADAKAIAVDSEGSVYVGGRYVGDYGPGNTDRILLRKYDSDGNLLWSARYDDGDGTDSGVFSHLTIDDVGNAYVVVSDGYGDRRILKYDSEGNYLGRSGTYDWAGEVLFGPDKKIYIADIGSVNILDTDLTPTGDWYRCIDSSLGRGVYFAQSGYFYAFAISDDSISRFKIQEGFSIEPEKQTSWGSIGVSLLIRLAWSPT